MAAVLYSLPCQQFPLTMDITNNPFDAVEYVPNPNFSFPAGPMIESNDSPYSTPRRTTSLKTGTGISPSPRRHGPQHKSVSTLPTFAFNATDTSGRTSDARDPSQSAGQISQLTPRTLGHRRGASEFIGGDARTGMADLASTSPVKTVASHLSAENAGSPARKRGHAHRRSAAMTGTDLANIFQTRDNIPGMEPSRATVVQTALPSSASASSVDTANQASTDLPRTTDELVRATSSSGSDKTTDGRPKVGFAENVEIIPRPLSPILSDTESGSSTPATRSARDSISSMLDLGGVATPSPSRRPRSLLVPTPESDSLTVQPRASLDLSRGFEKEGHWLRKDDQPTSSDSIPTTKSLPETEHSVRFLDAKPTIDRRKSDPYLAVASMSQARPSSLSLQEPTASRFEEHVDHPSPQVERKSSARKVRDWASSMIPIINRKEKTLTRPKSADFIFKRAAPPPFAMEGVPSVLVSPSDEREEPDLEELFSSQDPFSQSEHEADHSMPQPRTDFGNLATFSPQFDSGDDANTLDLDAALGSNTMSPRANNRIQGFGATRRQLHSSRGSRDATGFQQQFHRRTESAPVLTRFEYSFSGSPVQSPMADVFEEDEEEEKLDRQQALSQSSFATPHYEQDSPEGVEIVDNISPGAPRNADNGLGIQDEVEDHQLLHFDLPSPSHQSLLMTDRRPSLFEETIPEEEPSIIEIVGDHEEPRASTITKSSDSSDTPTILADHTGAILSIPAPGAQLMTPTTYAASTFSTPDFNRRQGSFETSRLGTSASSMTDCRTMNSFAPDAAHGHRPSVDDVPSLTSSRSTMISRMNDGMSRRDLSDRSVSGESTQASLEQSEKRRKRSSIQSLTKLVGAFSESKSKLSQHDSSHSRASSPAPSSGGEKRKKKENRLSRLMFWKGKPSSSARSTAN